MQKENKWFSIIEVLIWIMIFSLGLVSVYMLIASAMKMNEYSKNSIIASHLAREWLEIVRNIRDNNYETLHNWNKFPWNDVLETFQTGAYYTVENQWNFLTKIDDFAQWKQYLASKMQDYQLYLTPENEYTYNASENNTKTYLYRFIYFDDVKNNNGDIQENALHLKSKVIWYKNGYHSVELDTILTHFQRD